MSVAPPVFVFVCVGPTCGERGGTHIHETWRKKLIADGLWARCRVVPVRCFGECPTGPNGACPAQSIFLRGMNPATAETQLADLLNEIGMHPRTPSPAPH